MRTPWDRLKQLESTVQDLRACLTELNSIPTPEDHSETVSRLEANVQAWARQVADYRDQMLSDRADWGLHGSEIEALKTELRKQTHAISEGIERTSRAERRIGQTIARARKELKERGLVDPGVEAEGEDHQLQLVDGEGGGEGGVPPVQAEVESTEREASSIRGVSREQLSRARGIG